MSGIVLTEVADATIPTPPAGKVTVYMSAEEAGPAFKDDAAAVTPLQGAIGSTGATGPGYGGTSTTSLAIGTGSKAFTTQAGRAYVAGSRVRAASDADPDADWMEGVCTAYSGTTLTVLMDLIAGSGTHTDWNLSLAGDKGATGAGVPPTVSAHGSMGSTETFNYTTAPAHEGTVDAALTITLTGFVAGECILTLGFTTDGTGGYGVPTFPAAVVNDADLAAVWDDSAGAYNLVVLRTVDSGTTVYIVGLPDDATLDPILAASSGEDIADALAGAAAPDAGNVFATMADVGGGGGGATSRMDYTLGTDISAVALTQNTWVDILANQNFTVGSATSIVEIAVRGMGFNNATVNGLMIRCVIDSAGTPINEILSGVYGSPSSNPLNMFSGINSVFLSGLAAATHTIKLQAYTTTTPAGAFYCRASANAPAEFLRIHIIEHLN